jgi:hypothetical protein
MSIDWDGKDLPPVGLVCEHSSDSNSNDDPAGEWFKVEIIAHHRFCEDEYVCAVWVREGEISYSSAGDHFRPLRNPEQIAAEKRASAVSAMLADAGVTDSAWNDDPETVVWAKALYDAGYRKFEIVEEDV